MTTPAASHALALLTMAMCLAVSPARAAEAPARSATIAVLTPQSAPQRAPAPATDFDDLEPAVPASPVTFGRALDLQGSPMRLTRALQPGHPGLFAQGRWTGPSLRPYGLPVRTQGVTSGFGSRWHPVLGGYRFHAGIDLAAPTGTAIVATSPGAVVAAGWCGGYGQCVTIDHGGGVMTLYGHLSRIDVAPGQQIARGQSIGLVGSTGRSTGPHLHYEVRVNGMAVNPADYLR